MHTSGPGLTAEERAHLVQLLRESENGFIELTRGLSDAQWTSQAAPGRWSVQQTAEHLVLGERALLAKAREALDGPPDPGWEEHDSRKTKFLNRVLPDRMLKAVAPAPLEPHHHWTQEETIARFQEGRAKTLQFVEEVDQPMKDRVARHPFPVFDLLNAHQWLLYIPLHNARHNQQIAEILKEIGP